MPAFDQFKPDFATVPEYARAYRQLGIQAVPAKEPREGQSWKRPALVTWRNLEGGLAPDSMFDSWFGARGEHVNRSNLGIITGKASGGIFVVDLDTHNHPEAAAWWDHVLSLRQTAGDLETASQTTGGGGRQLLFRAPAGWSPPTAKTPVGVDIRGEGGFAVLPPSRHESGRNYAWDAGLAPWEIGISDAPRWLCEQIDRLVNQYGGSRSGGSPSSASGPIIHTPTPASATNTFGMMVDGREDYMTRLTWARVVDERRQCPIRPGPKEIDQMAEALFVVFERNVKSRLVDPTKSNAELLEREGRGLSLLKQKLFAAFAQWEGKVKIHAKAGPPEKDRNSTLFGIESPINSNIVDINPSASMANLVEELVTRCNADPSAAFAPDVLKQLSALKTRNRASFEQLRSQLKKAGCRVAALDEAIATEGGKAGRGPTQADILIELAQTAELFHAPDGTCFADITVNGHRETWPIRAKGFRHWLSRCFFEETQGAPSAEALQAALNLIEAKAHFDGPERVVHVRVAGLNGKIYLDLSDETWRAVEIDATGWKIIDHPPVRFRRASGMQPLSCPVSGGSIKALRSFLNLQSDADFVLVVSWALASLRNRGPYPLLVLSGEQGSAKSTFSSILRALLDPNTAPLRALPREDRDLFIAARNGHVLAFDNVSGLPAWTSDTLCRLSTGGSFAVRQLYTDQEEALFDAARPVVLNGIEDIVTRPDLADRAVFLTLEPIPEDRRRPEAELWAGFEAERPRILGVLLDAVVEGLKRLPETHLPRLPRMADFALWATACETALWPAGTFWSAYNNSLDEAIENVLDADPVAATVRTLMATRTVWTGTATDLLGALNETSGKEVVKATNLPEGPRALAGRLRRATTFLRKKGIAIGYERQGPKRRRVIRITAKTD